MVSFISPDKRAGWFTNTTKLKDVPEREFETQNSNLRNIRGATQNFREIARNNMNTYFKS